jgi:hypothetical protein
MGGFYLSFWLQNYPHATGTKTARERNRGVQAVERDVQRRGAQSRVCRQGLAGHPRPSLWGLGLVIAIDTKGLPVRTHQGDRVQSI